MDKHSELEVKFAADHITFKKFEKAVRELEVEWDAGKIGPYPFMSSPHHFLMKGVDTFYQMGKGVVRHRADIVGERLSGKAYYADMSAVTHMFTVKKRKSADSLVDRKEVDLRLEDFTTTKDVVEFMKLMDAEKLFSIRKVYSVFEFGVGLDYEVCVAMYTASNMDGSNKRNFIEIEIDKKSLCTPKAGRTMLDKLAAAFQKKLELQPAMNASLFEMYKPKPVAPNPFFGMNRRSPAR